MLPKNPVGRPGNPKRLSESDDLTDLLSQTDDPTALNALADRIYPELKRLARLYFRNERAGHTLQPTALVHEAWLRINPSKGVFRNKAHFFSAAVRAMCRILIESGRRRGCLKRRNDLRCFVPSGAEPLGFDNYDDFVDFDAAMADLERLRPEWHEIVELRVFAHQSYKETASLLGLGESTVRSRMAKAKQWLIKRLNEPGFDTDAV